MFGIGIGSLAEKFMDAVGMPEALGDVVSAAVSYASGDYMGMVESAIDFLNFEDAPKAAATEYHKPDKAAASQGYASPPAADAAPAGPPVHPRRQEAAKQLDTLIEYFGMAESAGAVFGAQDGMIAENDLNAIVNGNFPADLKEAASFFLSNKDLFAQATPNHPAIGQWLGSINDLKSLRADIQKEIEASKPRAPAAPPPAAAHSPAPSRPLPPPAKTDAASGTAGAGAANSAVHPRKEEAVQHLKTLIEYYGMTENAGAFLGMKDGLFTKNDLEAIKNGSNFPPELKQAAEFFLKNTDLLDRATPMPGAPGFLGLPTNGFGNLDSLKSLLGSLQQEIDAAKPPASTTPAKSPTVRKFDGTTTKVKVETGAAKSSAKASEANETDSTSSSSGAKKASATEKASDTKKTSESKKSSDTKKTSDEKKASSSSKSSSSKETSSSSGTSKSDKGGDVGSLVTKLGDAQKSAMDRMKELSDMDPEDVNPAEMQKIQMELDRISQMLTMVSNIMQALNQLAMSIINNMK